MNISPLDVSGINEDKKFKVIHTALTSGDITRAEIADICSLSAVTVGKIISKMLDEGLLVSEKLPLGIGPHTEILKPSPKINTLLFYLGESRLNITVCDACQNIIFERSAAIDESLPYEDNLTNILMNSYPKLEGILNGGICGYAAATSVNTRAFDLNMLSSAFPKIDFDIVKPYDEYVCALMEKDHPDKNIILIHIGLNIGITLICEGKKINSYSCIAEHIGTLDIGNAISHIADTVAPLLKLLRIDRIVLESDSIPVNNRFINLLKDRISERTHHTCTPPEIISGEKLHLVARSAADEIAEKLAWLLSGKKKS